MSIATLSRIIADDKDKMRTAPLRLNRLGKAKPLLPKNSRHRKPKPLEAETVGDVVAFDSIAYRAYGRRVYAITAIDLYSRIGFAMMFSSKKRPLIGSGITGYGSVLIGADTSDTKRQRDGV